VFGDTLLVTETGCEPLNRAERKLFHPEGQFLNPEGQFQKK
jgi:hypothetical protein